MLLKEPFTTVWIEFLTVEQALAFYSTTDYLCRLSPECCCSVDIAFEGRGIPTAKIFGETGVRPQLFVLDPLDPLPFFEKKERITSILVAA